MLKDKMTNQTGRGSTILIYVILFLISITLINSSRFIYQSLFALYGYLIIGALFSIAVAVSLLLKKQLKQVPISPVIWAFLVFIIYVFAHGLLLGNLNLKHSYLIFSGLFFFSSFLLFYQVDLRLGLLFNGIICIAVLESFVCMLQFYGFLSVSNTYFNVTGTWANPNVTAMFLAMAFPACFTIIYHEKTFYRRLGFFILTLIFIAILLLKCRTAMISVFLSIMIWANYRHSFFSWARKNMTRLKSILVLSMCLLIGIFLVNKLYKSKQSSADGRKLIWKISTAMFLEKPILGYGYGNFEKSYNLEQASYFQKSLGSEEEMVNAGYVKMAYNEFLENTVTGGIFGGFVFTSLLVFLLLMVPRKHVFQPQNKPGKSPPEHTEYDLFAGSAYAAIGGFTGMSIFNFTVQAVPAFCLFLIYAALTTARQAKNQVNDNSWLNFSIIRITLKPIVLVFMILLMTYVGLTILEKATADQQNKYAKDLALKGDIDRSLEILASLEPKLSEYDGYWMNYANILFMQKRFMEALDKYNEAKKQSSNPEIYLQAGRCNMEIKNFLAAESNFKMFSNMVPNRMAPRFGLMKLYYLKNDSLQAITMAKTILELKPKIISAETNAYQAQARQLLKHYEID